MSPRHLKSARRTSERPAAADPAERQAGAKADEGDPRPSPINRPFGRRSSLQDVARLAGVSAAAVSYVVNGRTGEVGAETRRKIEAAITSLRYQPQRRGLSLKFNREFAIGLLIVDPHPNFLSDPFTTQIATGLSNALTNPGYGLTITGCSTQENFEAFLRRPISVDAFVILASGPKAQRTAVYERLNELHLPIVVVQDERHDALDDACAIYQDDYGGAQMLTRHVLDNGARNILFVAPSRSWPAIERREAGITSTLPRRCKYARVSCDERDFAATASAIDEALTRATVPDTVMGANDQIAIAALRVLERRGLTVPTDVQVTGFNDFTFRNYVSPLLTTVRSSADEIGQASASAILSRLDAEAFVRPSIELPVALDIGQTTGPGSVRRPRRKGPPA